MRKILLALILLTGISVSAEAQVSFLAKLTTSAKIQPTASPWINEVGAGVTQHQILWSATGTVSACTVKLEQSADGVTWSDLIAGATCTSNGNSSVTSGQPNYLRVNATTLTGTGTLSVRYFGLTPGSSSGTVTANIGTTGGLALDATLTGGTEKVQVYYGGTSTPISATDVAGVGGSASGTTSQYMNADTPKIYDASTNGKTTILALSSGKVTYVLGMQLFNSTASAVTVTMGTGTGTNCVTTFTAISPAVVLPAPSSASLQGFVLPVALAPYMKTAASENLCIQTNAAVSVQGLFQLTQF